MVGCFDVSFIIQSEVDDEETASGLRVMQLIRRQWIFILHGQLTDLSHA